jgi:hypothetical protein
MRAFLVKGWRLAVFEMTGNDRSTIGVNLTVSLAVETAAIQTKPACAGFKTVDFSLVRVGGLGFYSSEFHSAELKLTSMDNVVPFW